MTHYLVALAKQNKMQKNINKLMKQNAQYIKDLSYYNDKIKDNSKTKSILKFEKFLEKIDKR